MKAQKLSSNRRGQIPAFMVEQRENAWGISIGGVYIACESQQEANEIAFAGAQIISARAPSTRRNVKLTDVSAQSLPSATACAITTPGANAHHANDRYGKISRHFGPDAEMKRVFFDVARPSGRTTYDYHGRWFVNFETAVEVAELLVIDLSCSDTEDKAGAEVHVRSESGEKLFALAVPD